MRLVIYVVALALGGIVTENDEVTRLTVHDVAAADVGGSHYYICTGNQVFRVVFKDVGFAEVTELLVDGLGTTYRLVPRDSVVVGGILSLRSLSGRISKKGVVVHIVMSKVALTADQLRSRYGMRGRHESNPR